MHIIYHFAHGNNAVAIISAKTLYHNIEPNSNGSVTMLDILNALRYSGNIYSMSLTGLDIWKTLEIGVRSNGKTTGSEFVHVSGLQYSFNRSMPLGFRVSDVRVRCNECMPDTYRNIDVNASYKVITTELMYEGVDKHWIVKSNSKQVVLEAKNETEIILWYFYNNSVVTAELQGRMTEIS